MKYNIQVLLDTRVVNLVYELNPISWTGIKDEEGVIYFYDIKLKYRKLFKVSNKAMRYRRKRSNNTIIKSRLSKVKFVRLRNFFSMFDFSFLRKEKRYTKLKYSRSPQYDIVSGGVAALFSAFIGFLISEKFGIELVDSGDFYTFFMYIVFLSFSLRPLLRVTSKFDTTISFLSVRPVWDLSIIYGVFIVNAFVALLTSASFRLNFLFRRIL